MRANKIGILLSPYLVHSEPGYLCLYSDWLRTGRSDDWGTIPGGGWAFFPSIPCADRPWGPPSLLSNGYLDLFPWVVKRPVREADHSPPHSAEVKNSWSYISTPPTRLHGVIIK